MVLRITKCKLNRLSTGKNGRYSKGKPSKKDKPSGGFDLKSGGTWIRDVHTRKVLERLLKNVKGKGVRVVRKSGQEEFGILLEAYRKQGGPVLIIENHQGRLSVPISTINTLNSVPGHKPGR